MPDLCDVVGEREFEARPFQLDTGATCNVIRKVDRPS